MHTRLLTASFCALLCACSATEPRGPSAGQIREGACPPAITPLDPGSPQARSRYGKKLSRSELAAAQAREIDNCQRLLAAGNVDALGALAAYYQGSGKQAALVNTLETYAAAGSNPAKLRDAGSYLYSAYASGESGVPRDADKAFSYLGLAVNNGNRDLQLSYARALNQRGLHRDALRFYRAIAADDGNRRAGDRCQAYLSLAQLYFGGSPADENWNIGYYYWQQGLAMAAKPRWASCSEDNFTSPHYDYESRRRQFVESRMALMSTAQRQVIDEARRDPGKGLDFVAALNFQKPATAPVAPAGSSPSTTVYLPGWPAWEALSGQICGLKYSGYERSWSEVFEANARAIWTVDSRNGNSRSQGSAVAVSPSELVTNCHLIENPRQISIRQVGATLPARLKAADREGDRCILQVGNTLPTYVRSARSHAGVRVGEDVAAIGNPRGLETSLSRGIVGQKRSRGGLRLIQTDAAISSGSSGGGLFDRAGYLVGVTTFRIAEGQGLNFAIAIDEFCR